MSDSSAGDSSGAAAQAGEATGDAGHLTTDLSSVLSDPIAAASRLLDQLSLSSEPGLAISDLNGGEVLANANLAGPVEIPGVGTPVSMEAFADASDPIEVGVQLLQQTHSLLDPIIDTHTYEAHVAMVLDTGPLPSVNQTLDLLTTAHDLFDVPTLDVGSVFHDQGSA